MTAHTEATAADGAHEGSVIRRTWLFLPLFAPFGISAGYVSVTLGFILGKAGLPIAAIGVLVALSVWPQTWKVLWAPIVDTTGNPKLWYGLGAVLTGLAILAMSAIKADAGSIPFLKILIVISSIASTLVSMSTEIFMAHFVPQAAQGRASGWGQAGNLGGSGIGGGIGLLLAEHVAMPWVSGLVLALICIGCWGAVTLLPPAPRGHRHERYLDSLKNVALDVWSVAKSRLGYLALIIMLLPIASGGAQGLWSAVASEWRADANLVALVNGVMGGLVMALGCLLGGYVCDKMDNKAAYALFGIAAGIVAVLMGWSPRTPTMFVAGTLGYALAVGMGYAAYNAIVLEAIGKGAAATKFNLLAAVSNIPIAVMTEFDGWMHDEHGTMAMLYGELALPAATIAVFFLFVAATRSRKAATG
ncbi:MAG: MFS transporter [Sphingobium sp.]|nr:MFS transporter [Sphingobium sp.]